MLFRDDISIGRLVYTKWCPETLWDDWYGAMKIENKRNRAPGCIYPDEFGIIIGASLTIGDGCLVVTGSGRIGWIASDLLMCA